MNIAPSSIVRLYKDVPFNSSYKDTILFESESARESFLSGKHFLSFNDSVYIRHKGAVRLPIDADKIRDCNYMSFLNEGFTDKWFYAFIDDIEYMNTDVCAVYFTIDLIQSWLFDFNIGYCFVEREHVADDTIGKHTVPENLPFGDLVTAGVQDYKLTPVAIMRYADETSDGVFEDNIYNPLKSVVAKTPADLNAVINNLADQPEKIAFLKMGVEDSLHILPFSRSAGAFTFNGDSYTPENKKLYCYPYCSFTLDDYSSLIDVYKWEDFADPLSVNFECKSGYTPYPYTSAIPENYKNQASAYNYMQVKNDFPDCPFIIDNFRAWSSSVGAKQNISYNNTVTQQTISNVSSLVSSGVNGAVTAGTAVATGGASVPGAVASGAGNAMLGTIGMLPALLSQKASNEATQASMSVDKEYAKTHGESIGSTVGSSNVPWAMGLIGWRFIAHTIKPEYARIVDGFLKRFGYKVERYKVPETKSRLSFNYVKTVDANITGSAPDYALAGISAIFDAGITLWHTSDVGNYSLRNEVI